MHIVRVCAEGLVSASFLNALSITKRVFSRLLSLGNTLVSYPDLYNRYTERGYGSLAVRVMEIRHVWNAIKN